MRATVREPVCPGIDTSLLLMVSYLPELGLVKDGGKMHLVLESENGERISVPINPEEFEFTDEEEEEFERRSQTLVAPPDGESEIGGDGAASNFYDDSTAVNGDGVVNGAVSRIDREKTPLAAAPLETDQSSGPEVGVATRMVKQTSKERKCDRVGIF